MGKDSLSKKNFKNSRVRKVSFKCLGLFELFIQKYMRREFPEDLDYGGICPMQVKYPGH